MIFISGKCLRIYKPEEIFTSYIYKKMKQHKNIMMFLDNKQILIDDEIDEWNYIHGLTDPTERIMYHTLNSGYVITGSYGITTISIPFECLYETYDEFISNLKRDINSLD